jgi:3-deoxy-manno-octulosonate cytidylyltransferase (CMP-KDO synthetase)
MKPLRVIAGQSLLHRTIDLARRSTAGDVRMVVATDDARIADHAALAGIQAVMTDPTITSGSGRALAAARAIGASDDTIVVNLQGDAPFQPVGALSAVIATLQDGAADVATPVVRLTWEALDALRVHKQRAPFSGTTCVRDTQGRALWFSKAILPTIRNEAAARAASPLSPVLRHVGLYGYRLPALEVFEAAAPTDLEQHEGLEQLRLLDLHLTIDAVEVAPARFDISGIDTEADIGRAEDLIAQHGDPFGT